MTAARALALALGLALVAGACGGTSSSDTALTTSGPATAADPPSSYPPPAGGNDDAAGDARAADPPESGASSVEAPPADPEAPTEETTDAPSVSVLPDVDVIDLATGETINLSSFAPADRPILLWFWAPH